MRADASLSILNIIMSTVIR